MGKRRSGGVSKAHRGADGFRESPSKNAPPREEFLENMPEGAARAGQGAIDSQALAALNNPNRIRRTSSDAVLAMLSGESVALPTDAPPPQPVAASGGIGIQRTSSDALMTFLAETETNV